MAAKAKLLLRELKTVKADLAFAKLRCSQLEEENRVLREGREKGKTSEDEDLVCSVNSTSLLQKNFKFWSFQVLKISCMPLQSEN